MQEFWDSVLASKNACNCSHICMYTCRFGGWQEEVSNLCQYDSIHYVKRYKKLVGSFNVSCENTSEKILEKDWLRAVSC